VSCLIHHYSPLPSDHIKPVHASTPERKKQNANSSNVPLKMLTINFQSIKSNQGLVKNHIESTKPAIVIGTETWIDPTVTDNQIFPPNYKLYRKDRNMQDGGVLIAISNDILSTPVHELQTDCEIVWAKISLVGRKDMYIASYYNPNDSNDLQNDQDKIALWETKWKMSFHPDKCNVLTISRENNTIPTSYKLHGHTLKTVESAKYLVCTFTSDLRWNDYVNNICNKANRTIGCLKRNLNIGYTTVKQNIYNALVRPLVGYAIPVWNPHHQTEIDRIEMVQRRAARCVTNSHNNRSSVNQMLEHLEWKSLEQRRKDARLTMMYKITNEKVTIPKEGRLIPPKQLSRNIHDKSFQIQMYHQQPATIRSIRSTHARSGTGTPSLLG
jgi:hypothetical protein